MKIAHRSIECVDLPLAGGRLLRVELRRHLDGDPADLVLCLGWGDPERFDRKESLVVPGDILTELRVAFDVLESGT